MKRRWLFGTSEYVHPALRWFDVPMLRAGVLLILVTLALHHSQVRTDLRILSGVAIGLSILVGIVNWVLLRRRDHG